MVVVVVAVGIGVHRCRFGRMRRLRVMGFGG
jgi:hypothetical protein